MELVVVKTRPGTLHLARGNITLCGHEDYDLTEVTDPVLMWGRRHCSTCVWEGRNHDRG